MNGFDVIVYTIRADAGAVVRSRSAGGPLAGPGRSPSSPWLTVTARKLIRAARKGLEFDPQSGEPVLWAEPEPVTVTWYQHAAGYAAMKWPTLAAHSRASVAEALATVTPALTRASMPVGAGHIASAPGIDRRTAEDAYV